MSSASVLAKTDFPVPGVPLTMITFGFEASPYPNLADEGTLVLHYARDRIVRSTEESQDRPHPSS